MLSADTEEVLVQDGKNLSDKNLFAYCDNNPIVRKDDSGNIWVEAVITGALIGIGGQYLSDIISNISNGATGLDILSVTSSKIDYLAAAAGGGAANAFGYAASKKWQNSKWRKLMQCLDMRLKGILIMY